MKRSLTINALTAIALCFVLCAAAQAQATRTWVSGVGDDANPCSRTAPCKTFAGAISKTAAGGEISALDPGGYGAVTITKSITINGQGTLASILGANTNGVIVNVAATDKVVLRSISIEGAGSGFNGVRMINASGTLQIEDSAINGFTQNGIDVESAGGAQVFIKNTVIRNNGGQGIFIQSASSASPVKVTVDKSHLVNNAVGLLAASSSRVTVHDSVITENSSVGILAQASAGAGSSTVSIESSIITNNEAGIRSSGAGSANTAVIRISEVMITDNTNGLLAENGGSIVSFGNNRIAGNTTDGSPTSRAREQ
jgi:hypothetical protein